MWDKPQALNWLSNLLIALAVLLFLYAALLVVVHSPLFPVRQIKVEGSLSHVTREQLQYIVKNELKGTFFTLDLNNTRSAFEKLPWVRQVNLRRRWPDRLDVAIEEHTALARWGSVGLLNTHGERFDAASNESLPVLEGPEGSEFEMAQGYVGFRDQLMTISRKPSHIWLSPRRAWRLQLDEKLLVEIGRDNPEQRLAKFVEAYPRTLAVISRPISYVDLRYPNGFAVRLPDGVPLPKPKPKPAPKTT
ncbi:cell division protein FtsQ/DivIB [Chitinimonas sp. BJB300]|uniref:cell division protein FtsQ/DivIB n=1 Tax=Chitinimonas sp. BJB300 TaxID=1559339 RepID=UPI000C1027CA|nr:FtsQ-type POTRA domain-containing protein [Chitinimonas sp. BJB300]PHV12776.1 cell division protein FtsQ [Chitinimonas sp. BJB300]TSJ91355.1 FtsQ-type POTRA domain-containing protein [Chitinimonas sp. BJB300]